MLEIIHAGAGSGKTFVLCDIAVQSIVAGMHPARLLATTFTRRAATELKQRIAAALLSTQELSPALRLERVSQLEGALIGTIHSVGRSLLTRYACVLGLSPAVRVIETSEAAGQLQTVLGHLPVDLWERLVQLSRQMETEPPEQLLLRLLAAKRENLINDDAFRRQMRASAQRVSELCAAGQPLVDCGSFQRLAELSRDALRALAEVADPTKKTDEARTKLRRIVHHPSPTWRCFLDAAKLTAGKRLGADALLVPLRSFAGNVRCERQLHVALAQFAETLCDCTLQLEHRYDQYNRMRGQVDFTDLERLFLQLLEIDSVRPHLQADIQLVLVDEVQDVSPLQLAIFSRLRDVADRCHWVGDDKQAIYGFRGSDPQLVRRVWSAAVDDASPDAERKATARRLPNNYRSAAGLVRVCGTLFAEALGSEARQVPVRTDGGRVERWLFDSKNREMDMMRLADGVAELIAEGAHPGEIAVLVRSNARAAAITAALNDRCIPTRLEQPGLVQTREGALLLAGLRVVADRFDSLASATVLHLLADPEEPTPTWLSERMDEVRCEESVTCSNGLRAGDNVEPDDGEGLDDKAGAEGGRRDPPWAGHPVLAKLRRIDHRWLSPAAVVVEVIEALHLSRHLRRWGAPSRRAAHVDALVRLAEQYQSQTDDFGEPPTLSGLIHHIEDLAEAERDVRFPPTDVDAVTLLTYHGAKGLEFPTVVLFDLDGDQQADPWGLSVAGGGATDQPLRGRSLRYWSWPFGRNPRNGSLLMGAGVEVTARGSDEGQAALRMAQEESMRLLYVGFTRARDRLVLAHRAGQCTWLAQLPAVDRLFPCEHDGAPDGAVEHGYDYLARQLRADPRAANAVDESANASGKSASWFDCDSPANRSGGRAQQAPQWHAPSRQRPHDLDSPKGKEETEATVTAGAAMLRTPANQSIRIERVEATAYFPAAKTEKAFQQIGDGVHAYFAALPSLVHCDTASRTKCAVRCLARHDASAWLSPRWLVDAGETFRQWTTRRWPSGVWGCEVPFTATRVAGGDWRGRADLLIWLDDGTVVLIDHKSAPLRPEHCEAAAAEHSGQIAASTEALSQLGLRVAAAYVHFPLAARIAQVSLAQ